MENIIKSFIEGPLANILVVSGILFLFLSIVGKIGEKIAVDPRKQKYAGIIGVILLLAGLSLHLMVPVISTEKKTTVQTTGKLVITKTGINGNNGLTGKISEIDIQIINLERELADIPQSPDPLHELQDIRQEREKHLEEIENLQRALSTEVEQLHRHATEDPGTERRIEQIEGETLPDLEAERKAVRAHLQELNDMIHNAEKRDELRNRINELKEQRN